MVHSVHCVQRTNIQNLKAIHNEMGISSVDSELCSKNEYTKSESNSQRMLYMVLVLTGLCSKNEYTKSESNSQHSIVSI